MKNIILCVGFVFSALPVWADTLLQVGVCQSSRCVRSSCNYGGCSCDQLSFTDSIRLFRTSAGDLRVTRFADPNDVILEAPFQITKENSFVTLMVGDPYGGYGISMTVTEDNNLPSVSLPQ